jgi:hypothetical protein
MKRGGLSNGWPTMTAFQEMKKRITLADIR